MMPTELCRMQVSELRRRLARRAVADPSHRFSNLADLLTWPPLVQLAAVQLAGLHAPCQPMWHSAAGGRAAGPHVADHGRRRLMIQLVLEPIIIGHAGTAATCRVAIPSGTAQDGITPPAPRTARWIIRGDLAACDGALRPRVALRLLRQRVADARFVTAVWQVLRAAPPRARRAAADPDDGLAALLWQLCLREVDAWWSAGAHADEPPCLRPGHRDSIVAAAWSGSRAGALERCQALRQMLAGRLGLMLPDRAVCIARAPIGSGDAAARGAMITWTHPGERRLRRRLKVLTRRGTAGRGVAAVWRALHRLVDAAEQHGAAVTPRALQHARRRYVMLRLVRWFAGKTRCTHRVAARRLAGIAGSGVHVPRAAPTDCGRGGHRRAPQAQTRSVWGTAARIGVRGRQGRRVRQPP